MPHGTHSRYSNQRCRCERCRKAEAQYKKALYADRYEYVAKIKAEAQCMDCGEGDEEVFEFDHVRGERKFTIMAGVRTSWPALLAELEKCDIICANCHVRRSKARGQFRKHEIDLGAG